MQLTKRIIAVLMMLVMLVSFSACASKGDNTVNAFDEGAANFGNGKGEKDYRIRTAGQQLEQLIDDFSGGFSNPSATPLGDEDKDDAIQQIDDDESADTPSGTTITGTASSDASFLQLFYDALAGNKTMMRVDYENGYQYDLIANLDDAYTTLQRRDPVNICCLESVSVSNDANGMIVIIDYNMTIKDLEKIKTETPALIDDAVKTIQSKYSPKSDYEAANAVNEYLCDTVYYPDSEPYEPVTHTVYGALYDGCAVCEGYACAAKMLLNELGTEADIEVGACPDLTYMDKGGGHAWNLVKVDGAWYQLDVTWNDAGDRKEFFLITDRMMSDSREWKVADYPQTPSEPYSSP